MFLPGTGGELCPVFGPEQILKRPEVGEFIPAGNHRVAEDHCIRPGGNGIQCVAGRRRNLVVDDSRGTGKVSSRGESKHGDLRWIDVPFSSMSPDNPDRPERILLRSRITIRRNPVFHNNRMKAQSIEAFRNRCSLMSGPVRIASAGEYDHTAAHRISGKQIGFQVWLKRFLGSGQSFPEDLSSYALVIHCGGCMLNEQEMQYRLKEAASQGVPMTNYGT